MANNLGTWLETDVLNTYFVNPTTNVLALFTADPGKGDTPAAGSEVTGGGYARKGVTFSAPTANGTAMQTANAAQVNFAQATADWGTVGWFAVYNAAGHCLTSGPLTATKIVQNGDTFQVPAGNLTVSLD